MLLKLSKVIIEAAFFVPLNGQLKKVICVKS